ncbi:facilitated trehalose transporter Tret1-like [Dermacentor andersoni]|uniref:facilitated trehalose transporter Tret1-like n=1 Tax=Dermacentor andersoni TaxID=34620 RepID=UPI0024160988|nr:facilitated trehalose transporter Tret1-like [Dermacentor andersoni]
MSSDGSQCSPSSPSNAAMAALRRWRPPAKGGSPLDDIDLPPPCGLHERAMLVACLGSCAAGTTLSYTSAAMPFIELEPWYQLQKTAPANRWAADVLLLGATGGALLSGILLPLTGHRRTLLISAFGLVCAWICLISSNSVVMLMVSRVASGLWLGALACCSSLYVTDVSPPKKRAFFGGMIEVAMNAGALTACFLDSVKWEFQACLCTLWPLAVLAFQHYVIESPRSLAAKGRRQEANVAASRLYGMDLPPELRQKKGGQVDPPVQWLKMSRMVSGCLLLFLLQNLSFAQLFQPMALQVSSYLTGMSYGNVVALLLLAGQTGLATISAAYTHLVGRRWLLGASAVLVTVAHFTLGPLEYLVFSTWTLEERSQPANWRGVASIVTLVLGYSLGLCHLPPLLTGELVPLRMRYLGSAVIWATRWIVMFLMAHFEDSLLAVMQTRQTFLAFCLVYVLTACITIALIPETEGRSLVDIAKDE